MVPLLASFMTRRRGSGKRSPPLTLPTNAGQYQSISILALLSALVQMSLEDPAIEREL
jgi:hypothetical protein